MFHRSKKFIERQWRLLKKRSRRKSLLRRLRKGRRVPVLVYQMGKVGSTSTYRSLSEAGVDCIQVHRIHPSSIRLVRRTYLEKGIAPKDEEIGMAIWEGLQKSDDPVKIITMVREPVSRNISAYFQNLNHFFQDRKVDEIAVGKAMESFLCEYPHRVPLEWFEDEFRKVTGIDVYAYPFDPEIGYTQISSGRFEVLIMRVDLSDEQKCSLLDKFLGIKGLVMNNANISSAKTYATLYSEFKKQIQLPEEYVESLMSSDYATHFYSSAERDRVRDEWHQERTC